jgi:leader peptidase (prepilin peptidase)/N-methyltransferase
MNRVEGLEVLLIAVAALAGAVAGMAVDRYPAPLENEEEDCAAGSGEITPVALRSLHPGIEIACTATSVVAAFVLPTPLSLVASGLSWVLLVLTLIDLRYLEVPDAISLPLVAAGLAATWWLEPQAVLEHALAAACAAVAIWLLGEAFRRLRGVAGIGGDVRLFAAAGAWVGLAALPGVVFLSGVFGLIGAMLLVNLGWVAWRDRIPFVPAISAALWTVFLMPELMRPRRIQPTSSQA